MEISLTTLGNHRVNAIAVNPDAPPVVGGIPVVGTTGKYYVSKNSFGNRDACEFSNRIYILDTVANTATLLYEENSSTLSHDDPRACSSDLYLLATEDSKLVMKYHTLGTNQDCDSAWSEPNKTWYLDVTQIMLGMTPYYIPASLYEQSEQAETTCRAALPQ